MSTYFYSTMLPPVAVVRTLPAPALQRQRQVGPAPLPRRAGPLARAARARRGQADQARRLPPRGRVARDGMHGPLKRLAPPLVTSSSRSSTRRQVLGDLHERLRVVARASSMAATRWSTSTTARATARWRSWSSGRGPRTTWSLVQLSRNFGMEVAMSAGLDHARGDYVVLMHADLQDPPELIPDMLSTRGRGGGRRGLRAPHRPRREPGQATAGHRLLRDDANASRGSPTRARPATSG